MNTTTILNATTSIGSMADFSGFGWIVTVLVFVLIFLICFLIFKNFRRAIYGAVCSGIILGVYKFSRWIGISTQNKNYVPVKWFIYIAGFILASLIIGLLLDKFGLIKKFEKKF